MENNAFSYTLLDTVSVTVHIAGKDYPMRVKQVDEQRVQDAAARLNEQMTIYRTKFSILEKHDLLAMVAFDSMFEKIRMEEQRVSMLQGIASEIDAITSQIGA